MDERKEKAREKESERASGEGPRRKEGQGPASVPPRPAEQPGEEREDDRGCKDRTMGDRTPKPLPALGERVQVNETNMNRWESGERRGRRKKRRRAANDGDGEGR